jgi:hypothetical protein
MSDRALRDVLTSCVLAGMLTACSELPPADSGSTALSVSRLAALTMPDFVNRGQRPDRGKSWMKPSAKKSDLLYVSDWYTNNVFVYAYPSGAAMGTLTGFSLPYGMCVDKRGDIFITNFGASSAVEYAHGGTAPLRTLNTGGDPIGCSVSPSDDLAVTNYVSSDALRYGSVVVFHHAKGTGATYTSPTDCYYMWPGGYDDKNNLWIQGEYSHPNVCELAAGSSSITPASFNQAINYPGGTMWDGKYIALTDQEFDQERLTAIYRAKISGSSLTQVGTPVALSDDCAGGVTDVTSPFVVGAKNTPVNRIPASVVVGSNVICVKETGAGRIDFWKYPAGGNAVASLADPPKETFGAAVSIAGK